MASTFMLSNISGCGRGVENLQFPLQWSFPQILDWLEKLVRKNTLAYFAADLKKCFYPTRKKTFLGGRLSLSKMDSVVQQYFQQYYAMFNMVTIFVFNSIGKAAVVAQSVG